VRGVAARDDLTTSSVTAELKRAHKFSENFIETEFALASARSKDQARRTTANIAKLPVLLRKP
jgi:hypothetical protein